MVSAEPFDPSSRFNEAGPVKGRKPVDRDALQAAGRRFNEAGPVKGRKLSRMNEDGSEKPLLQ